MLEARLGNTSRNSLNEQSSDGPGEHAPQSLRRAYSRKPGEQGGAGRARPPAPQYRVLFKPVTAPVRSPVQLGSTPQQSTDTLLL